MTTLTAILASTEATYLPGRTITKPLTHFTKESSLVDLVADAAARFDGSGVLLLDARGCAAMGLPWRVEELPAHPKDHPAENALRDAGWSMSMLRAWTTLHAEGRPTVHLCLLDLVGGDPDNQPVIMRSHADTVSALDIWHQATGCAWFGPAGTASTNLMRAVARTKGGKKVAKEPTWQLTYSDGTVPEFIDEAESHDFKKPQWRNPKAPLKRMKYWIGYDVNRMYAAAARVARLAPWRLTHTGKGQPYTKDIAGVWKVRLEPWPNDAKHKIMPAPFGYTSDNDLERWVSGPTLDLLDQLVKEGFYAGYEVLDSWTCRDAHEILKPWAEVLNQAYLAAHPQPGEADVVAARVAFKMAYKQGWGMLGNEKSRVYRPDWAMAIKDQARSNLWRKMRAIGNATGRWPSWIDTDCLYYPTATNDAEAEAPEGLVLGNGLGQFDVHTILPIPGRGADVDQEAAQ